MNNVVALLPVLHLGKGKHGISFYKTSIETNRSGD
jgi:hypothetical protein